MADGAELAADQHICYIITVEKKDSFESLVMEHIRLNGAYWGLTALDLLHKLHAVDAAEVVDWTMSCYHPESGGFGGNVGIYVLYTLSAVQVLCLLDRLDALDVDKVADYVAGLQNEDGSFSGDIWVKSTLSKKPSNGRFEFPLPCFQHNNPCAGTSDCCDLCN